MEKLSLPMTDTKWQLSANFMLSWLLLIWFYVHGSMSLWLNDRSALSLMLITYWWTVTGKWIWRRTSWWNFPSPSPPPFNMSPLKVVCESRLEYYKTVSHSLSKSHHMMCGYIRCLQNVWLFADLRLELIVSTKYSFTCHVCSNVDIIQSVH